MADNTSLQLTNGCSPFFLMLRQQARLLIKLAYGASDITPQPSREYTVLRSLAALLCCPERAVSEATPPLDEAISCCEAAV